MAVFYLMHLQPAGLVKEVRSIRFGMQSKKSFPASFAHDGKVSGCKFLIVLNEIPTKNTIRTYKILSIE